MSLLRSTDGSGKRENRLRTCNQGDQPFPEFGLFLGIDLTLAGDIHGGGQMSLDFVHRGLNLGSLMGVPYIRGLYEKGGAQVYMNRGIGITGFPIRLGARPEITVLELTKG